MGSLCLEVKLHRPQKSRLTSAILGNFPSREENGPRRSEPACKLLIFAYPAFADERSDLTGFMGQALTGNTIVTKTMDTRHKHSHIKVNDKKSRWDCSTFASNVA